MKKILITGGAGFIGYHLACDLAKSKDNKITIIDDFSRSEKDNEFKIFIKNNNVRLIEKDITKQEAFLDLETDFDYVYHLAAINGTGNFYKIPDKVLKVGTVGTINVLEWFVKQKKGKIIYASSSEAYASGLNLLGDKFPIPTPEEVPLVIDNPKNVRWSYGAGKLVGEVAFYSYAKAYNINFSIIRYHNVYGPREGHEHVIPQFIERILKKEFPFKIYGGEETRTFCYIDDAVRATRLIMETEKTNGEIINLGNEDDEIKIISLAKMLFDVSKIDPKMEVMPAPVGCVKRRYPDISKLKKLGFKPKVSLKDGLNKCYLWYKDNFNMKINE